MNPLQPQVSDCNVEEFKCNGRSNVKRVDAPGVPSGAKVGRNSINITLLGTDSSLAHVVELAVSKQAEATGAGKATVRVTVPSGISSSQVDNLNLGTAYYIRCRAVGVNGVLGQQSKWSDLVDLPCPEGAMCGTKGALEGVAIANVFPLPEYYRVPWAKDNLTFALCNASGAKCVGGENETCINGTMGPFCSECLPNYARTGAGKCDKCMESASQNFAFVGAAIAGIAVVAYLVRGTLKAEGNPSDVSVGVIKIGMRHFQLAAMAASFPLEWPSQINGMFALMSTASSAGDQAVALDCQLGDAVVPGSDSLYFGSMVAAKALFGFIMPPLLIAGFAAFWIVYTRYVEGRPFGDRGSRGDASDGTHQSSLKTRLIVST